MGKTNRAADHKGLGPKRGNRDGGRRRGRGHPGGRGQRCGGTCSVFQVQVVEVLLSDRDSGFKEPSSPIATGASFSWAVQVQRRASPLLDA